MNIQNIFNNTNKKKYFSFSLWFQISSISSFCLRLLKPENIAERILSFNSFMLKTLKKVQLKCEMCDLYSFVLFVYQDIDKYRHAGISFLTKMYQFTVECTTILKIRQNVHQLTTFHIAILNWFQAANSSECIGFLGAERPPLSANLQFHLYSQVRFIAHSLKFNPRSAAALGFDFYEMLVLDFVESLLLC